MCAAKEKTRMRIVVYIDPALDARLRAYVAKTMGGRHGGLSIAVEKAIEEYLEDRMPEALKR